MPRTKPPQKKSTSEVKIQIIVAIIAAITGIIVALITYGDKWFPHKENVLMNLNTNTNINVNNSPTPNTKPTITITSPPSKALAHVQKSGSGWVEVRGTSENVSLKENQRIYVFYQSAALGNDKWWYGKYADPNSKSGWAIAHVWIGRAKIRSLSKRHIRSKLLWLKANFLRHLISFLRTNLFTALNHLITQNHQKLILLLDKL